MPKRPFDSIGKHRICVICEGLEEYLYFQRLTELGVWSRKYEFNLYNAHGEARIFYKYSLVYNDNAYEAVLIFCDTDKAPSVHYRKLKNDIDRFHAKNGISDRIVIFANPCSMQLILLHFGEVKLVSQGKKTNAAVIEKLTGVRNYDGHEEQIRNICSRIFRRSYAEMRERVKVIYFKDTVPSSSNFIVFIEMFESDDSGWIRRLGNELQRA